MGKEAKIPIVTKKMKDQLCDKNRRANMPEEKKKERNKRIYKRKVGTIQLLIYRCIIKHFRTDTAAADLRFSRYVILKRLSKAQVC